MGFNDIIDEIWYRLRGIRRLGRFILRLFSYLPIIWKDEDWDYDYLYQIMEFKLKRLSNSLDQDTWHLNSKRKAQQIRICLAYLDRYRNWTSYIDYPTEDIVWRSCEHNLIEMIHDNSINEAKRKKVMDYEEFNYDMFWKRFLQWHRGWWT